MRALLLVLCIPSLALAQGVGARGAIEIRTPLDQAPPAPGEEGAAPSGEPETAPAEPDAPADVAPEAAAPVEPEAAAAVATEPATAAPAVSEAAVPEAAVPEAAVPEAAVPEAAVPEAAVPEPAPETSPSETGPTEERVATPESSRALQPPPRREERALLERVLVPVQTEHEDPFFQEVQDFLGLFGTDRSLGALLAIFLWLGLAILLAYAVRWLRDRLPQDGLIPNVLAFVHLGVRLIAMGLALAFIIRMLPPRLSLVMLLAFGGFAVALGWSMRDVMPDLVAGFVLVFERRIRRGAWISGGGFAGQVDAVGIRATLLRDARGHQVSVPNRQILQAPVTAGGSHDREHEVTLRMRVVAPADEIRAALRDAVLASPWVFPGSEPVVLHDSTDPSLWRVRGRLLEATFGARFEGELLERAESLLADEPQSDVSNP
ncbi:MAG: mechanosensitive ion channel domain-containing protein [Myxococcota bacterium]